MKTTSKKDFEKFKKDMDNWVKQIIKEIKLINDDIDEIGGIMVHNYDLIYELKDEIEQIKMELNTIKIIQIVNFKNQEKQKCSKIY